MPRCRIIVSDLQNHVGGDDPVEIWDVRRPWIPKWRVDRKGAAGGTCGGSAIESVVKEVMSVPHVKLTSIFLDMSFSNAQTLWTVNANGTWHQLPVITSSDSNTPRIPASAPVAAQHSSLLPIRPKLTRAVTKEGAFSTLALLMTSSKSSSEPTSTEISRDASTQGLDAFGTAESSDSETFASVRDVTCVSKPLSLLPKTTLAYSPTGTLVFTEFDRPKELGVARSQVDIPYDDESVGVLLIFMKLIVLNSPPIRRKHLEGPTYMTSQVLRWAHVPVEDKNGFARLASGYRLEWQDMVPEGAKEAEGKAALCKWNARVRKIIPSPLTSPHSLLCRFLSSRAISSMRHSGGYSMR